MSNTVPEGWQVRSISDLVTLQYGKSPKEVMAEDGQYPVIGTGGVTGYASSYLYDGCTTVIGRKGTINKPSYVEGKFWAIDTTYFGTGYKGAEPKWFYYSLNSFDLSKHNEASGVPSLGRDTLNAIPLLTPPLPEQQKIAAILSSVDDVIEKTRAQIDKLKDLKTGMMQELLTKGIGHTEFKDSTVGRIPLSWEIRSLKSLCRRITDGTHQSVKTSDSGKIPFLYVSCIRNGEILWDKASGLTESDYTLASKGRVASPGDILFTAVGSYGHAALVETDQRFSFQRHIAFIQPDMSTVDPRYLVSVLNSTLGRTQADRFAIGNAQLSVTLGDLGTFIIPTPPLHEQHQIAKTIGAITSNIHEHDKKLGSLLNLKKALMQDLLTGKVRVKVDQKESAVA